MLKEIKEKGKRKKEKGKIIYKMKELNIPTEYPDNIAEYIWIDSKK